MLRLLSFAVIILFYDTFRAPDLFIFYRFFFFMMSKPDLFMCPHGDLRVKEKKYVIWQVAAERD